MLIYLIHAYAVVLCEIRTEFKRFHDLRLKALSSKHFFLSED